MRLSYIVQFSVACAFTSAAPCNSTNSCASKSEISGKNRVCIFDVDQTLTSGEDCPSLNASISLDWPILAVKRCQDMGYEIGIATARPAGFNGTKTPPAQIPFDVLPEEFYSTDGYQMALSYTTQIKTLGGYNKTQEVIDILNFYEAEPNCAVFFDDMIFNLDFIDKSPATANVTLQRASDFEACHNQTVVAGWNSFAERNLCLEGGCGIRESEFDKAMETLILACPDEV